MSRHLLIRCDAPGCDLQTETHASDTEPTRVDVPSGWLTLLEPSRPHRHYCSLACLARATAPALPATPPPALPATPASAPAASPEPVAARRRKGGASHVV